ncbi:unnamed protein product [Caenorhabditis brenneri]
MESPIQLIDMPEDSMRHILERCDFVSLQCLRKTCHTFRNFIDETKPSQLNVLDIFGHPGRFSMTFSENTNDKLYPAGTKVRLDFNESGGKNTKITWYRMGRKREKIIENNNYLDVFSRTLGTVLECKQPKWNKISLGCHEEALKKIHECILALTSPLKVHSLRISSCKCLNLVVEIMKSFCSDTLAHLHFDTPSEPWNMSEMVKLEQWKKATELNMRLVIASPTDIESYSHFQYAIIFFENITVDDLCKIKKLFLNTPSITKRFELYGLNSLNKNLLVTKLGEPYISGDPAFNFWYFKRDDNYVLCIKYSENLRCFDFSIINKVDVPQEAIIH